MAKTPTAATDAAPDRLAANLAEVRSRIADAAGRAGRGEAGVRLVAVTKSVPVHVIRWLAGLGVEEIGENRVPAAAEKAALIGSVVRWHMIGHLQRNKAKRALGIFDFFHSVDSPRLLSTLDRLVGQAGETPIPVLAQVNVSGEPGKHGLAPGDVEEFLTAASEATHVEIEGLMGMAPLVPDPEGARPSFARLRGILEQGNVAGWYKKPLDHLSMGMTNDYEVAVEEGATLVRVGTALFEGVDVGGAGAARHEGF